MTLDELIDDTWTALRPGLFRRALLGRQRCAELVMLAVAEFPDRELRGCPRGSAYEQQMQEQLTERVAARFRATSGKAVAAEPYGFVFLSIVLMWAIAAIVQHLVVKWWERHFDAAAIRSQYGWREQP